MAQKLEKAFSTKDVLALAFGTMIGWGWIMLSGQWAVNAGMLGAILAYVIGAIMCIFVGLAYAELTPSLPVTGGSAVYSFKALGYWGSVLAGLAASFSYLGVAAWEGPALATAVDYIVEIPKKGYLWSIAGYDVYITWALVAIVAAVILTWANIKGASFAAVFQKTATLGIIVIGILFVCGSVVKGDPDYTHPMFTTVGGFMATMLMVPAMFVGFDVIPQSAGEMNVPLNKIPKILVISIIAAGLWYMLMIFATCMSAPEDIRVNGEIPVADAMAFAFGHPIWGKVCIVGALCGIITSWNGFIYAAARCLFAMANAKILPAGLAKLHPKYGTPYRTVLLCGILSLAACFLGKGALSWFVNASSFGVCIMYFMDVLAFILLRKKFPELQRPYKIKHMVPIAILAMCTVAFFIYLYLPFGPSALAGIEWLFVLGWFIAGGMLALWAKLHYKDMTDEEREAILIPEEELGREVVEDYVRKALLRIDKMKYKRELDGMIGEEFHASDDQKQVIVAISREFGSGGHTIAELVAEEFGIELLDKNILEEIQKATEVETAAMAEYDEKPSGFSLTQTKEHSVAEVQREYIKHKAEAGDSFVIVGRGAGTVLKDHPALLSVFVGADREDRIRRIVEEYGIEPEEAERSMNLVDAERIKYHKQVADFEWGDSAGYNLSVNTSTVSLPGAALLIAQAARVKQLKEEI